MKPEVDMNVAGLAKEIHSLLDQSRRILVASHVDPDGDALGTQLAFGQYLKSLDKEVLMARDSVIPAKYKFLPHVETIIDMGDLSVAQPFDTAVVLECPTRDRLGAVADLIGEQTRVINIDHHPGNVLQAEINWVDTELSSVGEMVYEYFELSGYEIDREVATQLYAAILTDTGRFRYSCTGPRTLEIAGALVRAGADARDICDRVYFEMSPGLVQLTGELLSSLEYLDEGRICIMTLTPELLEKTGVRPPDTEGLIDYTLYPRGVEAGALLRAIEPDFTKISLRSRLGLDVSWIAAQLGGGGHVNAAGCELKADVETTKTRLVDLVRKARDRK